MSDMLQDFQILAQGGHIDACAQFMYKGFQVSMSTIGVSKGGCINPIAVFKAPYKNHHDIVGQFRTVEDAINYLNGDTSVEMVC